MAEDKRKKLVLLLIERTNNGKLDWQPMADEKGFQVSFARASVCLSQSYNTEQDAFDTNVSLLNEDATVVDSFSDEDLDADEPGSVRGPALWYKRLSDLYEVARRTALGSEKVLDDILASLSKS